MLLKIHSEIFGGAGVLLKIRLEIFGGAGVCRTELAELMSFQNSPRDFRRRWGAT